MIYELPQWIDHENRFTKISCELLIFLLCETAFCISIVVYLTGFSTRYSFNENNLRKMFFIPKDVYMLLIWSITNTLTHSMLIYHSIRKVSINVVFQLELFLK